MLFMIIFLFLRLIDNLIIFLVLWEIFFSVGSLVGLKGFINNIGYCYWFVLYLRIWI